MIFDRANIYVQSGITGEFWQGEILSRVIEYRWAGNGDDVEGILHPLAVVLSADCDLTQDFGARSEKSPAIDKLLSNLLMCDVYTADEFRANRGQEGTGTVNRGVWDDIKKNKVERYHYLAEVPATMDLTGEGISDLAIDFKQYFCVANSHLLKQLVSGSQRRFRLAPVFSQHLAQRFFYYQSRIGLPADHAKRS